MKIKVQYLFICALSVLALIFAPLTVLARDQSEINAPLGQVIITEVQTGGVSASDEFVELFNASDSPVDISGWQVRFNAADATNNTTTLLATIGKEPSVVLPAKTYFVLHTTSIDLPPGVPGQQYPAMLTKNDKTVALFGRDEEVCQMVVQDAVAWQSTPSVTWGEGLPASVSAAAVNAEKLLQRYVNEAGNYIDTNDNSYDFYLAEGTPGEDNANSPSGVPQSSASQLQSFAAPDCETNDTPPTKDPNEGLAAPMITELLPNPEGTDTGSEYIEIFNPNTAPFYLNDYVLTDGTRVYTFAEDTVLASGEWRAFFSTFTLVNGVGDPISLRNPDGQTISESVPYSNAPSGKAWAFIEESWQWTSMLTPNESNEEPEEPPAGGVNNGLLPPQLTEILPDPGTGLSDSEDEFIEFYNPNDKQFDLSGYIIEVGTTNPLQHTIPEGIIMQPRSYLVLFSADTDSGPLLANNGGRVRLLDTQGVLLSETNEYPKAKADQAWALIDGVWQWTLKPTPGVANIAWAPAAASTSNAKTKAAAAKKASNKKSASKAKVSNSDNDEKSIVAAMAQPNNPLHPGLLALVGVFAVLYGAYEYRHDLANKVRIFRSNREARRALGQGAKGR